jgi:hypothetical protein
MTVPHRDPKRWDCGKCGVEDAHVGRKDEDPYPKYTLWADKVAKVRLLSSGGLVASCHKGSRIGRGPLVAVTLGNTPRS